METSVPLSLADVATIATISQVIYIKLMPNSNDITAPAGELDGVVIDKSDISDIFWCENSAMNKNMKKNICVICEFAVLDIYGSLIIAKIEIGYIFKNEWNKDVKRVLKNLKYL